MGVTSVNGKKNVRANSPVVAKGVLVPKVVYLDAKDFKTSDGKTITKPAITEINIKINLNALSKFFIIILLQPLFWVNVHQ